MSTQLSLYLFFYFKLRLHYKRCALDISRNHFLLPFCLSKTFLNLYFIFYFFVGVGVWVKLLNMIDITIVATVLSGLQILFKVNLLQRNILPIMKPIDNLYIKLIFMAFCLSNKDNWTPLIVKSNSEQFN